MEKSIRFHKNGLMD